MSDYQACLDYIESYWDRITFRGHAHRLGSPRNIFLRLGTVKLPHRAASPNHKYFRGTQYYWDSYFTILGLVVADRVDFAREIVENQLFLFNKFGIVVNRNTQFSRGRTQPPFLTQMGWEVYEQSGDQLWLEKVMETAKQEYRRVWTNGYRYLPRFELSRYRPRYWPRWFTTYESGWDVSSRFSRHSDQVIPIDLNSLLYQYEADFLRLAELQGNKREAKMWRQAMAKRRKSVDKYLWDSKAKFYFDYDLEDNRRYPLKTLAAFFPLWAKMASPEQAAACVAQLKTFEYEGGLATSEPVPWRLRQWDYPNGWPNLHWIVIQGLRNYGYDKEAKRITRKWLELNRQVFEKTGVLWEKYDVVAQEEGKSGRYLTQEGFGWTNAIFLRLLHEFGGKL